MSIGGRAGARQRMLRRTGLIAAALVITPGVVEKHVANIFAKLGLPASDNDNRRVLAVLRHVSGD